QRICHPDRSEAYWRDLRFAFLLVNAEVYFDVYFHWYGFALERGGLELVLLYRFYCFFIQPHPQVAHHGYPLRIALRIHNQRDDTDALILGAAGLVGKLWVGRENQLGGGNASTDVVKTAAVAATFTRTISVS